MAPTKSPHGATEKGGHEPLSYFRRSIPVRVPPDNQSSMGHQVWSQVLSKGRVIRNRVTTRTFLAAVSSMSTRFPTGTEKVNGLKKVGQDELNSFAMPAGGNGQKAMAERDVKETAGCCPIVSDRPTSFNVTGQVWWVV